MGSVKEPAKQVVKEIRRATRRRSNRKNTSPTALPLSEAAWIMLKEVMPSGRTPRSSPSRYAWSAPSDATAAAITSSRGRCGSVDAGRDRGVLHALAVKFLIFVQPFRPFRGLLHELGQLRLVKRPRSAALPIGPYGTIEPVRPPGSRRAADEATPVPVGLDRAKQANPSGRG